jgi:hypothetical protein
MCSQLDILSLAERIYDKPKDRAPKFCLLIEQYILVHQLVLSILRLHYSFIFWAGIAKEPLQRHCIPFSLRHLSSGLAFPLFDPVYYISSCLFGRPYPFSISLTVRFVTSLHSYRQKGCALNIYTIKAKDRRPGLPFWSSGIYGSSPTFPGNSHCSSTLQLASLRTTSEFPLLSGFPHSSVPLAVF